MNWTWTGHEQDMDRTYTGGNLWKDGGAEDAHIGIWAIKLVYDPAEEDFSFRMRRTLSSMRCSVISPVSTALTTASKASVNTCGPRCH